MEYCKAAHFPFLSGIRLEEGGSTPLVDNTIFRQLIGSLLYLTHLSPDISYAVSVTAIYMQEQHKLPWKETKHILHYVQCARDYGIHYTVDAQLDLIGYIDLEWDGDGNDTKYSSSFVFMLGSRPICWSNKKQAALALYSEEAEYQGAVNATIQAF